jgi:protein O-GlcNAc transferase
MTTMITYRVDLEKLVRQELAGVPARFQRALALHQEGQLDRAQVLYDDILRIQPRHFDATHLSGLVASQSKNPRRAVELFERAIDIDRSNAALFCNMGSAFCELRQLEAALACYERAIALKADFAEALSNRGNVLKELKLWREALSSYAQAIAVNPNNAATYSNRGGLLLELGQLEAALADCDRALAIDPTLPEAHANRTQVLRELIARPLRLKCDQPVTQV